MPLKASQAEALLQSKFNFSPALTHSDDHKWFELKPQGLPPIRTKISHGEREIGLHLESIMASQLGVTRKFFAGMFECSNDAQAYLSTIRTNPTGVVQQHIELHRKRADKQGQSRKRS